MLRKRIYGAVTCLSALLLLVRYSGAGSPPWVAGIFADYVSDVAAHGHPGRSEMVRRLRDSGQILEAFALPILVLVLATLGLMPYSTALWAGIWITVLSLGLFALLAARRLPVLNGQRAALVLALLALGAVVVAVKTLAH